MFWLVSESYFYWMSQAGLGLVLALQLSNQTLILCFIVIGCYYEFYQMKKNLFGSKNEIRSI